MKSIKEVNSIFEQPWYLEAVAPGKWESIEIKQNGHIVARLPIVRKTFLGFPLIGMPPYTQTLGVWIKDYGGKLTRRLENQKDCLNELIAMLPKRMNVDISLDHKCDYILPWYWNSFKITPYFSFRIEEIFDLEMVWGSLRENIRREIRKAEKIVSVRDDLSIDVIIEMQRKTFARQNRNISIDECCLHRLDEALINHDARKLLCAVDSEGCVHAAVYFVYDEKCCYYLIGGGDPKLRNSGAASLILWEGIKFASSVSKSFDFQGGMIEDIERFFRAFGAYPQVYYKITKLNTILSFADYIKPILKRMIGYK